MSAIGITIQLEQQLGVTDVLILEKESGLSGTWHVNSYPGCACDIPASLYSYSFAQNPYWSKMHPGVKELKAYFENVADKYHVSPRARLNTVVLESRFDDATGLWHFIAQDVNPPTDGSPPIQYHYVSKIFVMAVGGLSEPNKIDIPGHEKFSGAIFHSQRWDHSVDLKNKDVVVVGNGCTAAQLVPIVRREAKSLTQFARSKHWIAPVPHNPLEDHVPGWKWLIRHVPLIMWINRAIVFFVTEFTFNLVKLGKFGNLLRALWKRYCINHVHRLAPKKYWDLLIPTDQEVVVGCKRRIFDNDYLASLNAPNIELIPENLQKIGKDYVETKDGRKVHADAIIMCTGFSMLRAGFPMFIYGRNGEELHQHWATYGRGANFAYRSSMQANFPNMGMLMGANSATGHTSVIFTSESQYRFLLEVFKPVLHAAGPTWRAIKHSPLPETREHDAGLAPIDRQVPTVEVTLDAELNDLNWVCKKMTQTVFNLNCGAWYKDRQAGRVTAMHPDSQIALRRRLTFPNWSDLRYTNLSGHAAVPATMPWWKWYGNRLFGLGALPIVDKDDPAIAYSKPYGSIAAQADEHKSK